MTRTRMRRGTSSLLHGRPGSGKSTLLHTLPGPRLITDAEFGDTEFDEDEVTYLPWEEFEDEDYNPKMLTRKTSVVLQAHTYSDYRVGINHILGDHHRVFKGFGLDSITAIQDKFGKELAPLDRNTIRARERKYSHWGALLDYMYDDLEQLHQLTLTRGLVTAWVCQSNRETSPMQPSLAGALRQKVLDIPDIVGFLRVEEGANDDGEKEFYRILDIQSAENSLAETKCRRRKVAAKWGSEIPHPDLRRIAAVASPRPNKKKEARG